MKQMIRKLKMSVTILLVGVCLISYWACGREETNDKESLEQTSNTVSLSTTTTASVTDDPSKPADPMQTLSKLEGVVSLTEYSGKLPADVAGYQLTFISGEENELKISAEIILPIGFEKSDASLVFYFPEVFVMSMNDVANMLVSKHVGVVRLFGRGYGNSEGIRDLGGKDIADAITLFSLCEEAGLTTGRRIYAAGSSEGSITALRMAEQLGDKMSGVAAVDLVSDLEKYAKIRGEGVIALFSSLIGCSADDNPDEYKLRSACYFVDKIKCPVLLIEYKEHPGFPKEQYDLLEAALKSADLSYERYTISSVSSDFLGDSGKKLLSWIASHN